MGIDGWDDEAEDDDRGAPPERERLLDVLEFVADDLEEEDQVVVADARDDRTALPERIDADGHAPRAHITPEEGHVEFATNWVQHRPILGVEQAVLVTWLKDALGEWEAPVL